MKQQRSGDRKTALVTGASRGIGYEFSRLLAADGHDLILIARGIDDLNRVADELKVHANVRIKVIAKKLAARTAVEELAREIEEESIEILVNNAGVGFAGPFAEMDLAQIEQAMQLNIVTLTALTHRLLSGMLARGQGQILNVASLGGDQPGGPGMAVYYATKAYVLFFSRALAAELRGTYVTVTVLSSGPVTTDFEGRAGPQHTRLHWLRPTEARTVGRTAYRGMQGGRSVVIPGLLPKVLSIAGGLPPRTIALQVNQWLLSRR